MQPRIDRTRDYRDWHIGSWRYQQIKVLRKNDIIDDDIEKRLHEMHRSLDYEMRTLGESMAQEFWQQHVDKIINKNK